MEAWDGVKRAYFVAEINPDQRLFRLDPPLKYTRSDYSGEAKTTREMEAKHVVSSRCFLECAAIQGHFEVYLFAANEAGEIDDWLELPGSQKNTADFEKPIRDLGYSITDKAGAFRGSLRKAVRDG